jgi:hypothetical protein
MNKHQTKMVSSVAIISNDSVYEMIHSTYFLHYS